MNFPNWKLSILWNYLKKKIKKVEVPWWIYFYPAPFRGNWLLEIMCRTLLQRYIKSSLSDIDWCVVTVVRYPVCQHFNLAARRSRSFNNWNCKYIHTCLKRSSRIIRLIRSATATFFFTKFMTNFVKISAITTITYCVLRCDGCQLRLCSLFSNMSIYHSI